MPWQAQQCRRLEKYNADYIKSKMTKVLVRLQARNNRGFKEAVQIRIQVAEVQKETIVTVKLMKLATV